MNDTTLPPQLDKALELLFQKHLIFLLSLSKTENKKEREHLIVSATHAQLNALRKLLNIYFRKSCSSEEMTPQQRQQMLASHQTLATLALPTNATNTLERKKRILIQKGGFFSSLIPLIAGVVAPALASIFK